MPRLSPTCFIAFLLGVSLSPQDTMAHCSGSRVQSPGSQTGTRPLSANVGCMSGREIVRVNFPWQIRDRGPNVSLGGILAGSEVGVL